MNHEDGGSCSVIYIMLARNNMCMEDFSGEETLFDPGLGRKTQSTSDECV